eukprot:1142640-Pelagomonas_calceolata.AAC.3
MDASSAPEARKVQASAKEPNHPSPRSTDCGKESLKTMAQKAARSPWVGNIPAGPTCPCEKSAAVS